MAEGIKRKLRKIKRDVLDAVDDGGSSPQRSSVQKKVTALISAGSKGVRGRWPGAFKRDEDTKTSNNDLINRGEQQMLHLISCGFGDILNGC